MPKGGSPTQDRSNSGSYNGSRGGGLGGRSNSNRDSGRDGSKFSGRETRGFHGGGINTKDFQDRPQVDKNRDGGGGRKGVLDYVKEVVTERFDVPTYKKSGVLQQVPVVGSFVTLGDALARYASSRGISVNPTDPTKDARNGSYNRAANNLQPQPPAQPGPSLPDGVGGHKAPNPDYLQSAGRPPLEAAFDMALRSGRSRVRIPLLGAVRSAKGAGVSIR